MIDRLRVCYYVTEDVVAVWVTAGVVIWPQRARTSIYLFPGIFHQCVHSRRPHSSEFLKNHLMLIAASLPCINLKPISRAANFSCGLKPSFDWNQIQWTVYITITEQDTTSPLCATCQDMADPVMSSLTFCPQWCSSWLFLSTYRRISE
jgi:hypothetical protein